MKKIAYDLGPVNSEAIGTQRLYQCVPPLEEYEYVVVSSVVAPLTGAETYTFGANKEGKILDWGELEGSYKGGLDHETALENAGYEVADAEAH